MRVLDVDLQRERISPGLEADHRGSGVAEARTWAPSLMGKVTKVVFGAFVELNNVEGLVHISEMAATHRHPGAGRQSRPGRQGQGYVTSTPDRRRISLSGLKMLTTWA